MVLFSGRRLGLGWIGFRAQQPHRLPRQPEPLRHGFRPFGFILLFWATRGRTGVREYDY